MRKAIGRLQSSGPSLSDLATGNRLQGGVGRHAGVAARAALTGVASLPNFVIDGLQSGYDNLIARPVNALGGSLPYSGPLQSAGFQSTLDAAGLPRPESRGEQLASAAIEGATGAFGADKVFRAAGQALGPELGKAVQHFGRADAGAYTGSIAGNVAADSALHDAGMSPTQAALVGAAVGVPSAMAASKVENAAQGVWRDPRAQAMDRAARERGVTLSAGDLAGGQGAVANLENFLQNAPLSGRRQFMQEQNQQLGRMMQNEADRLAPPSIASGQADSAGEVIARGLQSQYQANKATASRMFDAVEQAIAKRPEAGTVGTINFQSAAKELLKEYPEALKTLQAPTSLTSLMEDVAKKAKPLTYRQARTVRSQIGSLLKAARRQEVSGGSEAVSAQLAKLFDGIASDFEDWAKTNGGNLGETYSRANQYFRENVAPYRNDRVLYQAAKGEADTDQLARQLLRPDRGNLAEQTMRLMDEEGRHAARYELARRAAEAGSDPNTIAGIAPKRYLDSLELGNTGPAVLGADGMARQSTNQAVVRAARRSPSAAVNPQTGRQLIPYALGGGLGYFAQGDPMMAALAAAGMLGAGRLGHLATSAQLGKGLIQAPADVPTAAIYGSLPATRRREKVRGLLD